MSRTSTREQSKREELADWQRFIRSESHILTGRPLELFQEAANQPDITAPARIARRRFEAGVERRPWPRWVNKLQGRSPCVATLAGSPRGVEQLCRFVCDGNRILAGSRYGGLRLWDVETGLELGALAGKLQVYSASGIVAVSALDERTVTLWDAQTGTPRAMLAGKLLAWTPDGARIVTTADDRTLTVRDATTGAQLTSFTSPRSPVTACVFSPDASRCCSASGNALVLWDAATGAELTTFTGARQTGQCFCSPDGHRLVSFDMFDGPPTLWDAASGAALGVLDGGGRSVAACVFSADGQRIVTVSDPYSGQLSVMKFFDAASGSERAAMSLKSGKVRDCFFVGDERRIMVVGDEAASLWDAETRVCLATLIGSARSSLMVCEFSADDTRIVSATLDGIVKLWDGLTGSEIATLLSESSALSLYSCGFSPDGSLIVAGHRRSVGLWDGITGQPLATFSEHSDQVKSCAFSPDGSLVASGSEDGTVKLWDVRARGDGSSTRHGVAPRLLMFSPDGTRVISAPGGPAIWDARSGERLSKLEAGGESAAVFPDGSRIASTEFKTLAVWDAMTGVRLATFAGHSQMLTGCAVSPDGSRIVSASHDKTLKFWDAGTGAELATLLGHRDIVVACMFTPDGERILSYDLSGILKLWHSATGACVVTLNAQHIADVAFSPDGRRIVSAHGDGTLRFWDARTGVALGVIEPNSDLLGDRGVRSCSFSPEGTLVVAGSQAGRLAVWDDVAGIWTRLNMPDYSMHLSVEACAFSPDGRWIAAGANSTGTIRVPPFEASLTVWDASSHALVAAYRPGGGVAALAWSPDCTSLVVGTALGEVRFLRLENAATGPPIVTAAERPGGGLAFGCPICRRWSEIENEALGREQPCHHCAQRLILNQAAAAVDWKPIADAWRLPVMSGWLGRRSVFRRRGGDTVQIACLACRSWFPIHKSALGAEIDTPCCGRRVKISDVAIDADWRPIAKAWSEIG